MTHADDAARKTDEIRAGQAAMVVLRMLRPELEEKAQEQGLDVFHDSAKLKEFIVWLAEETKYDTPPTLPNGMKKSDIQLDRYSNANGLVCVRLVHRPTGIVVEDRSPGVPYRQRLHRAYEKLIAASKGIQDQKG